MSFPQEGAFGRIWYAGGMIGAAIDFEGMPPVTGDASLSVDLGTLHGAASFTSLAVHADGTTEPFAGGVLHYPFELSDNAIVGTNSNSTLLADFYGPGHEDVAGTLHDARAGLLASFGATVDDRPDREDVIASANYLGGLSRRNSSSDEDHGIRVQYQCNPELACNVRRYLGEWTAVTREDRACLVSRMGPTRHRETHRGSRIRTARATVGRNH